MIEFHSVLLRKLPSSGLTSHVCYFVYSTNQRLTVVVKLFSDKGIDDLNFILDAALIELPEKFNLNPKFVNPVCLPNNFGEIDESWNHKKFTISGWGNVNSKRKFARKLQFAQKSMKKLFKVLVFENENRNFT